MRTRLVQLRFAIAILLTTGLCQAGQLGAGVVLGSPTALTGKLYQGNDTAFDFGLSFSSNDYMLLYGDYLKHYPNTIQTRQAPFTRLAPYIGIGALVAITSANRANKDRYLGTNSGSVGLGIRIPIGIEWLPSSTNLAVFGEIVPGVSVIPSTDMFIQAGIGIRYLF